MGKETEAPDSHVPLGWLINQHFPGYVEAYFGPSKGA